MSDDLPILNNESIKTINDNDNEQKEKDLTPPPIMDSNFKTKKINVVEFKEIKKIIDLSKHESHDIEKPVNRNKIITFNESSKGSCGVFFIETEEYKIIVLKAGSSIGKSFNI
jgi:hypothetical protein